MEHCKKIFDTCEKNGSSNLPTNVGICNIRIYVKIYLDSIYLCANERALASA